MPSPTPSLPALPPATTKALPINTLPPLPTFTKSASTPQVVTTTLLPSLPAPTQGPRHHRTHFANRDQTGCSAADCHQTRRHHPPAATKAPPSATAVLSAKEAKIFMIAINDNGTSGKKIGCNDSAVPVTITLADPAAPLRGALDKLMAVRTQYLRPIRAV